MPSHHRARVFQTVILILFLGLSYLSFVLVHKIAQSRSEESFQVLADQILTSIDRRLEEYDRILDGVSGLVMASDVVTAADMEVYAKSLDIPGDMFVLDGIGLASAGSVDPGAGAGGPIVGGMNKRTATSSKPAEDQFIVQYVGHWQAMSSCWDWISPAIPSSCPSRNAHARRGKQSRPCTFPADRCKIVTLRSCCSSQSTNLRRTGLFSWVLPWPC